MLPMATVTFDTLKFTERLRAAGVTEQQAKAIAEALQDAQGEANLVTKADLQVALAELKTDVIKWMVGLALAQLSLLVGILVKIL